MSASAPTPLRKRGRGRPRKAKAAPAPAVLDSEEPEEEMLDAAPLDVEIPPAEEHHESFLDRAKAKLGLSVEKQDVEPRPRAARLTKQQQQIVDLATPLAAELGIDLGAFAWGKLAGEDYRILAPSEEVATKIVAPLARVVARSLKVTGKISPNGLDLTASGLALAGYMVSSIRMYRAIKKEEYLYVSQEENSLDRRARSAPLAARRKTQNDRTASASAPGTEDQELPANPGNVRAVADPGDVDQRNLSAAERFQYERLSQLRVRDIEGRRRRSGIA